MAEIFPLLLFVAVCLVLLRGYPVAFSLAGTALAFALIGYLLGYFDLRLLEAMPSRLFGNIMTNITLIAVPLFVFMGLTLDKTAVAENMLTNISMLFGRLPGGLGIAIILVGALLAASTGIVGATVVALTVISLPVMLRNGYNPSLSSGVICATGTLGQIIPPSIALVLLGDVMSSAYQQAQLSMGNFSPESVSIGDLFIGAIGPGLMLVLAYALYLFARAMANPVDAPPARNVARQSIARAIISTVPALLLIAIVLGSIFAGVATPTEAAGLGAAGALLIGLSKRALDIQRLREIVYGTAEITSMVFLILIGASIFSLVFRGLGGDEVVHSLFTQMDSKTGAIVLVMAVIFFLGFILDFIEITFMVVPIVAPVLLTMGFDPVWLGVMLAINLQTSFLTPPFGFALFYLRGAAPAEISTTHIYRGVAPFILIQLAMLVVLALWPGLVIS